jgi:hypothetical protein
MHQPQTGIAGRHSADDFCGSVGGMIIDHQNLEEALRVSHLKQRLQARSDDLLFIPCGYDNGDSRTKPGITRISGAGSSDCKENDQQTVEGGETEKECGGHPMCLRDPRSMIVR